VAVGLLLVAGAFPAAHAVTMRITYDDSAGEGFSDPTLGSQRKAAFEAAINQWGQSLRGSVPIDIEASFDALGGTATSAVLGQAGPASVIRDFSGAPRSSTWYALAMANQFAGSDLAPGLPDIIAQFNSSVDNSIVLGGKDFYYGTDGNAGGDVDFYSVVLHELCHGLGFVEGVNEDGSFSSGFPVIYDRFLAKGASAGADLLTSMNQTQRSSALVSNSLFFGGDSTRTAGGGSNAKLYAPNPYETGSSVSHLDESTYSGDNELMTPVSSGVTHSIGPLVSGIFQDMGWTFTSTNDPPTVISITPNSGTNDGSVSITSLAGTGFQSGATVKLTKAGATDISGTSVNVVSTTQITCAFNLSGASTGSWNLVVTDPDSLSGTLTGGFTVNAGTQVRDVALTAFSASPTSASRKQTVTFSYTVKNNGNVTETNFTFRLTYNGKQLGQPKTIASLAAGQQTSGTINIKVPRKQKTGDYLITGTVSTVSGETNTSNNSQTVKFTVK